MAEGNFYIPVWWTTTTDVNSLRFSFVQTVENERVGSRQEYGKSGEIFALKDVYQGTLVPAVYFPFTPDSTDESVQSNSGRQYYRVNSGHVAWDMPAGSPTCDKIIVAYVGVNLGGDVQLQIDEVNEAGQTVDTDTGGATDFEGLATLTVAGGVAAGQEIRLVRISGDSRIKGIIAYASGGTVDADDERIIIGPENDIMNTGSSAEWARQVAPAGSPTKWVGGYAHQGVDATTAAQIDVTETINIDGGGANPVTLGYHRGISVVWNRVAAVDYDSGGNSDIAETFEWYTFTTQALNFRSVYSPNVVTDRDLSYEAMLPMNTDCLAAAPDVGYVPELIGNPGTLDISNSNTVVSMWGNTGNVRVTIELVATNDAIDDHFIIAQAGGTPHRKVYFRVPAEDDIAIGGAWGATWEVTYHIGTAPDPVAVADVESGVDYHGGLRTGTFVAPAVGNVIFGTGYGASGSEFTGTYVEVADTDVRLSITYGEDDTEFTGNAVFPAEAKVADGIQYGANGTEFTGSLGTTGAHDHTGASAVHHLRSE